MADLGVPVPYFAAQHSGSDGVVGGQETLSVVKIIASIASCTGSIGIIGSALVRNGHTGSIDRHPLFRASQAD